MKINPIHLTNMKSYQKAAEKLQEVKSQTNGRDKLEISEQAKELLKSPNLSTADREKKVETIKKQYESGTYEVNYKRTAEKFIKFWTE